MGSIVPLTPTVHAQSGATHHEKAHEGDVGVQRRGAADEGLRGQHAPQWRQRRPERGYHALLRLRRRAQLRAHACRYEVLELQCFSRRPGTPTTVPWCASAVGQNHACMHGYPCSPSIFPVVQNSNDDARV